MQYNSAQEYLDALNNETDDAHIDIVLNWIVRARQVMNDLSENRLDRRKRMVIKIERLIKLRDDLQAGRSNDDWNNQKVKAQSAIDSRLSLESR